MIDKFPFTGLAYVIFLAFCISSCNKDDQGIETTAPENCLNSSINVDTKVSADTVFVTADGGTAPYKFSVDGNYFSLLNTFNNLEVGTQKIFVQDANGCFGTGEALIEYKSTLYDGRNQRVYNVVKIGNQVWMAENLKYATTEDFICYNDTVENCLEYGALYTWKDAQEACPTGWRLPTSEEFNSLTDTLEVSSGSAYNGIIADEPYGFAAKFYGIKNPEFEGFNTQTAFWTSEFSASGQDSIYTGLEIISSGAYFINSTYTDSTALQVRCIRE